MMVKYRARNQELWAKARRGEDLRSEVPDRRTLIFDAVQKQLEADGKAPFDPGQKLNDAPYRYARDEFHASLISLSRRLAKENPAINFGVEDNFTHPTIASFTQFVNTQLTKSVSSLITGVKDSSRWA